MHECMVVLGYGGTGKRVDYGAHLVVATSDGRVNVYRLPKQSTLASVLAASF